MEHSPLTTSPVGMTSLARATESLAGEFRLTPLLERILTAAVDLMQCDSGSLCLVDQAAGVYRKVIDLGVGCQSGEEFPLTEGVTGAVVRNDGTVNFRRYSDVPFGHVSPNDIRHGRSVIGVPIRLGDEFIGACIVFGNSPSRVFDVRDAELLELFALHAATAIATSRLHADVVTRASESASEFGRESTLREIHDTIGRSVASIVANLESPIPALGPDHEELKQNLERARRHAREALEDLERSAQSLVPHQLRGRSLNDAVNDELEWVRSHSTLKTDLVVVGGHGELPAKLSTPLFRIAREALSNAVRHSDASRLRVGLIFEEDNVSVVVEDDGEGFAVGTAPTGMGTGLAAMEARAEAAGGVLTVDSTPGWGTRVTARLPRGRALLERAEDEPIRAMVVHENAIVRAGLVATLSTACPDVRVIGSVDDPADARATTSLLQPDVVVVRLRRTETIARHVSALRNARRDVGIVLVGDSEDDAMMQAAALAGVNGVIGVASEPEEIALAVRAAARGDVEVPSPVRSLGAANAAQVSRQDLTPREAEVSDLVCEGLGDKQIATRLGISVKTVEKHVGALLRKTGAHNRTMLAVLIANAEAQQRVSA